MSKVCQVTGKRPQSGNNVSHANNRTRRRFLPNLHYHRFWVESEQRFVRLRVSAAGMRIIDKKGIDKVLNELELYDSDPMQIPGLGEDVQPDPCVEENLGGAGAVNSCAADLAQWLEAITGAVSPTEDAPWAINLIALPWMSAPLSVKWRPGND